MAIDVARFQGQPVAAVLANTAPRRDAAELIDIEWQELPALLDGETRCNRPPSTSRCPITSPMSTTSRPAILTARSRLPIMSSNGPSIFTGKPDFR